MSELSSTFENSTNKQKPITHITFDDGYLDNLTYAFGLLKKHNIRFSIFITSDFIDNKEPFVWWYMVEHIINNEIEITFDKYHFTINEETYQRELKKEIFEMLRGFIIQTFEKDEEYLAQKLLNAIPGDNSLFVPKMLKWKQINELIASGLCEVGIHTKSHARFCNLNKAERVEQIMACKEEIFSRTGTVAKYFAYPYGSKTDIGETKDLKEIMESCGIELAFTTIADELNHTTDRTFVPRVFINNSTTMYSLKSRLNGSFQRSL
ncbi:MAG: polysaccharide deacetylase [Segetibacter sp.]|nr:polysaccharide deacetylase [Segetibacter sp.]